MPKVTVDGVELEIPQGVIALMATEAATNEEARAAKTLESVLNACISDGTKAEMNLPALRSVLALAAWRRLTPPKNPTKAQEAAK